MEKIPAAILLIIATILWGGNFVIGRAVATEISPFTLAFLRWSVALLFFYPFIHKTLARDLPLIRKKWPIVLAMSLTGVAAFNTLVYVGLHYTTAINASLMNATTPILIFILSFLFLKIRLKKIQVIGAIISFIGVLSIISNGSVKTLLHLSFNKGDVIVFVAVICWSIYSLLVKQYAQILPARTTFFICIVLGTIMLLPFFLYELINTTTSVNWSLQTIAAIFYTGIFASIIAFLFWNNGVVRIGANSAGIFLNFIPVFATIFAVLFIGENLHIFQAIGGALAIFGVFLSTRIKKTSST